MPGRVLPNYFLKPREVAIGTFAEVCGLSRKHASNIIHDRAPVSPETALGFATVLETSPEFWINLQNAVDLHDARERLSTWQPHRIHADSQHAA